MARTLPAPPAGTVARAIRVRGLVQGVGFRPFVHRLALHHGVHGLVRNESGAVYIEVQGDGPAVSAFVVGLRGEAPPNARCDRVDVSTIVPSPRDGFRIEASVDAPDQRLPVAPDVAMCPRCAAELADPANRRFGYPFITCTDCGPRYTVIEAMPYDRHRTTMRVFQQCEECLAEYEDPTDRRHHSESNSCPRCGPHLWVVEPDGEVFSGDDRAAVLDRAAALLKDGRIVALRGLGGFHLAVDARNEAAVANLRARKRRDAKPLAVMVGSVEEAAMLARVGDRERELLESPERPIVLLDRRADARVAPDISPGLTTVGVMTAYTPMHRLLLDRVQRPLVMTSGNVSDEPIATDNDDALERLSGIADAFLLHDREIVARYDDSVVRVVDQTPVFIRRARGYAPMPVSLPVPAPTPLVAVGPHLKNTFSLVTGDAAFVSQHIGDLENLETLRHFEDTYRTYKRLFNIDPVLAVCDQHPGYLSTRAAHELGLRRVLAVQHHHAHVAAVAAEHGVTSPVIGLAYDGTGYGDDGCIWGGEVLVADLSSYQRVGHLRYAPLPGGDRAARQPWRSALAYLSMADADGVDAWPAVFAAVDPRELALARRQIERTINAFRTSSMGRLFDAAAAILGVRLEAQYEGQAAMELEALAGDIGAAHLRMPLKRDEAGWIIDPVPMLVALAEARGRGEPPELLAARFHESVAAASVEIATRVRDWFQLDRVALGGGVFQNARLLSSVRRGLEQVGFEVLTPLQLSPNDGAISYGQAAVAAATLAAEEGS
jgi:hydrogenase maturation protein HypF